MMLSQFVVRAMLVSTLIPILANHTPTATDKKGVQHSPQNPVPVVAPQPNGETLADRTDRELVEREVSITSIPSRDVFDWVKWGGDLLLVVVGIGTLLVIRHQASLMHEHKISLEQLAKAAADNAVAAAASSETIKSQVELMRSQTEMLGRSVGAAEKSAEAAKENLELIINGQRAHIRVSPEKLEMPTVSNSVSDGMSYTVAFYGPTAAFILDTSVYVEVTENEEPLPTVGLGIIRLPPIISSGAPSQTEKVWFYKKFSAEEIQDTKDGKSFVHFAGFIKYRDVFERERLTRFNQIWRYSKLRNLDGTHFGYWEKCGRPDDNIED